MTNTEFEDKINDLVGRPYNAQTFHCWSLVEELVPNAPKLSVIGGNYEQSIREFKKNTPEYIEQFTEVRENAKSGDIVLAGNNYINHAGVLYLDSDNVLVIHNDTKGVHVEPMYYFQKQYKMIRLLRC